MGVQGNPGPNVPRNPAARQGYNHGGTTFKLFFLGFFWPLFFYAAIGSILLFLFPFFPLLSVFLVFLVTVIGVSFTCLPTVYPFPIFNVVFSIVESSLDRVGGGARLQSPERKKMNRRILINVFRDLGISNGMFCFLSLISHFHLDYYYGANTGAFLISSLSSGARVSYGDVDPRLNAMSYADGGELSFITGSKVDTTRMGSYKPPGEDKMFCAAPVLYPGKEIGMKAQFWAVGVDCCYLNTVFWCDETTTPGVNTGYVVPQTGNLGGSQFFQNNEYRRRSAFHNAIENSKARYGIATDTELPVLIRWTSKGDSFADEATSEKFTSIIVRACIMTFIAFCCGIMLTTRTGPDFVDIEQNLPQNQQQFTGGQNTTDFPMAATTDDSQNLRERGGNFNAGFPFFSPA